MEPIVVEVKEVKDIIYSIMDDYGLRNTERYWKEFDTYCTENGRSCNNGEAEDLIEKFEEDLVNSYIC